MNPFDSRDPAALAHADERSLELLRHELVLNCDDGREPVIDELLRRGAAMISTETWQLGRARGLARAQIIAAGEEAVVKLALRLRAPRRLNAITPLARELAADAIHQRAPGPEQPPRLVSRPPELREATEGAAASEPSALQLPPMRWIERELRDAAREGRIRPNRPETS